MRFTPEQQALIKILEEDPVYLKVSGWDLKDPLLLSPRLEARRNTLGLGRAPYSDLSLIIEALFSTTYLSSSSKDEWLVDESVWCQHATLSRYIRKIAQARHISLPPTPQCKGFEAWANLNELKAIEVLFATPSTYEPVSSFGHTAIRLRYDDRDDTPTDTVYELVALVEPHDNGFMYVLKGLLGGYPLVLEPRPLLDLAYSHRAEQHRDIVRYKLTLTPEETRAVMNRLWEVERRGYLPYQFLSKNCSYFIVWLLESSLFDFRELGSLSQLFVPPSDVLDYLAERHLIREYPHPLKAFYHEVETWRSEQQQLAATHENILGKPEELKSLLIDIHRIRRIVEEVVNSSDVKLEDHLALLRFIGLELKVRQHQLALNKREIRSLRERAIVNDLREEVPTLTEIIRLRRDRYSSENPAYWKLAKQRQKNRTLHLINQIKTERYPRLSSRLKYSSEQRALYLELSATYALLKKDFIEKNKGGVSELGAGLRLPSQANDLDPQSPWSTHSGFRFWNINLVISEKQELNLSWKRAIWRELLGDQRDYGVTPHRSLTLIENELMIRWREGETYPEWLGNHLRVFEFSSFSPSFLPSQLTEVSFPVGAPYWGWQIKTDLYFLDQLSHSEIGLGGGFLSFNPSTSRWQLKLVAELSPRISQRPWLIAGSPVIKNPDLYGLSEVDLSSGSFRLGLSGGGLIALSYRFGFTGHLNLQARYERGIFHGKTPDKQDFLEGLVNLELPFSSTEANRFIGTLRYLCLNRCSLTFETGIAW